jgi:hypothetical protein
MRAKPSLLLALSIAALATGCATTQQSPSAEAAPATAAAAPQAAAPAATDADAFTAGAVIESLGIQLKGVRLNANGYIVDVRYRVLDPGKAQALLDRKVRPVLVDEASGDRYYVPTPPIIGALRQTARNKVIHTDRDYFMLFANPGQKLKAGSTVTLYVGDQRIGHLRVDPQETVPAHATAAAVR